MNESDEYQGTDCPDAYETEEDQNKDTIIDANYALVFFFVIFLLILNYV